MAAAGPERPAGSSASRPVDNGQTATSRPPPAPPAAGTPPPHGRRPSGGSATASAGGAAAVGELRELPFGDVAFAIHGVRATLQRLQAEGLSGELVEDLIDTLTSLSGSILQVGAGTRRRPSLRSAVALPIEALHRELQRIAGSVSRYQAKGRTKRLLSSAKFKRKLDRFATQAAALSLFIVVNTQVGVLVTIPPRLSALLLSRNAALDAARSSDADGSDDGSDISESAGGSELASATDDGSLDCSVTGGGVSSLFVGASGGAAGGAGDGSDGSDGSDSSDGEGASARLAGAAGGGDIVAQLGFVVTQVDELAVQLHRESSSIAALADVASILSVLSPTLHLVADLLRVRPRLAKTVAPAVVKLRDDVVRITGSVERYGRKDAARRRLQADRFTGKVTRFRAALLDCVVSISTSLMRVS